MSNLNLSKFANRTIVLLAMTLISTSAFPADDTDSKDNVDRLSLTDIEGASHSIKSSEDRRAWVLVFVTTDCPIANSYQPLLGKLHQEYESKGFQFALVHEGPGQTPEKLRLHAKEYGVAFPIVMDADHSIARKLDATKTPEAVIVGRDGRVVYQGRIDDLHQGFGKKRAAATREDLRIALDELISGKSISVPKTEAVGCTIPLLFVSK